MLLLVEKEGTNPLNQVTFDLKIEGTSPLNQGPLNKWSLLGD
jgi:hypothetical protein